ncbi:MAG: protein kinase [Kofleriaceae bacterium]|nr:protein kinase [Kofleriaceae bacterium]
MSRTRTVDRIVEGSRLGDYAIEHELAVEEIGVVYLGKHVVLPRLAELKIMHAGEAWLRAKAVQMLREACLLEALTHPGVPRVFECGMLEDKRPWAAFEHVEGITLGAELANGALQVGEVLELVRDVADILDHIHRRGIVHRRLSADAVVRARRRRYPVCVRNWSDACPLDAEGHITLDPRDDVHELGVIAYRGLTGQMPDLAGSARERITNAPPDVARLVDLMLSIDPSDRPSSAEVRERARNLAEVVGRGTSTDPGLRASYSDGIASSRTQTEDPAAFSIRINSGRPRSQ